MMSAYATELLLQIAMYGALAASLNIVAGRTGLLSVCHAAFFAVGAYSSAIVTVRLGLPIVLGVATGIVLASGIGLAIAAVAGRLKQEYFVLVTFAFQTVVSGVLLNWIAVTRGGMGIPAISPLSVSGKTSSAVGVMMVCILIVISAAYVTRSPYGRVLTAIRDDERFAASLGKDVPQAKAIAVTTSAAMAAVVGSLYAHWVGYVSPESFNINRSILILSMLILGGADTTIGAVSGAVVLVVIPEVARVAVGGPIAANLQGVFYGAVLVLAVTLRAKGIWRLKGR